MSTPTSSSYLTRRILAPAPSFVLLVYLQPVDSTTSQQLIHDRLAISIPVDATVAQLHSLIEQRYQQLISDDAEVDSEEDGATHHIVVKRVCKVTEFAYVVWRRETVGEVFCNDEAVQADVNTLQRSDTKQNKEEREETKEVEEEKQQQDGIAEMQYSSAMDDSRTSLTSPIRSSSARSTSLITQSSQSTPKQHPSRPTQPIQPHASPPRNRPGSSERHKQPQSDATAESESEERKERAAPVEMKGGKRVGQQLVQQRRTAKRTESTSEQADHQQPELADPSGDEQKEAVESAVVAVPVELPAAVNVDDGMTDGTSEESQRRDSANKTAEKEKVTKVKREWKRRGSHAAVAVAVEDEEVKMKETAARAAPENSPATAMQAARSSTSAVPSSARSETEKRGRKRKSTVDKSSTTAVSSSPPASPPSAPASPPAPRSASHSVSLSAPSPSFSQLVSGPTSCRCVLCGISGGVLKLTQRSTKTSVEWCHQMCATWCDGTSFNWKDHKVHGITSAISKAKRKKLRCTLCQQPDGTTAPVQCVEDDCPEAFHITCGVAVGYQTFEAEPDEQAQRRGIQEEFVAACPNHKNVKYDDKNDDGCSICTYTRPSQPEMSGKLTCRECGVSVHRTCYYNLPSDSGTGGGGGEDGSADGRVDWQRWTCMCCEYTQKDIYYFVKPHDKRESEEEERRAAIVEKTIRQTGKKGERAARGAGSESRAGAKTGGERGRGRGWEGGGGGRG